MQPAICGGNSLHDNSSHHNHSHDNDNVICIIQYTILGVTLVLCIAGIIYGCYRVVKDSYRGN